MRGAFTWLCLCLLMHVHLYMGSAVWWTPRVLGWTRGCGYHAQSRIVRKCGVGAGGKRQSARACVHPEGETGGFTEAPRARPPVQYVAEGTEMVVLRRRVYALERLVSELCGAVLYSDDLAVLERQTSEIGAVYRDGGFAEYRRPVYARNKIEAVLKSNGFAASAFPHTWQCVERVPGNSTGGSNSTNGTTALPRT